MKYRTILKTIISIEILLLIVIGFKCYIKIGKQEEIIKEQKKEINRLKIIEQDYDTDKEYIYECFKQIEQKAERSGK